MIFELSAIDLVGEPFFVSTVEVLGMLIKVAN